jgi:branched-subunit amino acid ABC-type transport system permease component
VFTISQSFGGLYGTDIPRARGIFSIGEVFISGLEMLTVILALIIMVVLFIFLRYSKLGVAMKATQQNNMAAYLPGIIENLFGG